MTTLTQKITPEQAETQEAFSLTGGELAAKAKGRTTIASLAKKPGGIAGNLPKVSNVYLREILRRQANKTFVVVKATSPEPVKAQRRNNKAKATPEKATEQVVSTKRAANEAFALAMGAYPEHPRFAGGKAARAVHLGMTPAQAVEFIAPYVDAFHANGTIPTTAEFTAAVDEAK